MAAPTQSLQTRCGIAGGGPAGMMLGVLLARAGVDVLVLEKHADFLRDFRGDTVGGSRGGRDGEDASRPARDTRAGHHRGGPSATCARATSW